MNHLRIVAPSDQAPSVLELLALAVGFPLGILATAALTGGAPLGRARSRDGAGHQPPATFFISHPNTFTVIVACWPAWPGCSR